ncbi:MAG: hypothetical protein AB1442_10900, partial [Nitrospirota bacterium]
ERKNNEMTFTQILEKEILRLQEEEIPKNQQRTVDEDLALMWNNERYTRAMLRLYAMKLLYHTYTH